MSFAECMQRLSQSSAMWYGCLIISMILTLALLVVLLVPHTQFSDETCKMANGTFAGLMLFFNIATIILYHYLPNPDSKNGNRMSSYQPGAIVDTHVH